MKKRKKWFHCTEDFHGEIWTAKRHVPEVADSKEPPTPRLCVGPTIASCFGARLFEGDVFVYQTVPRKANEPRGVWDSFMTREKWIVPPVDLNLHSVIPAQTVDRVNWCIRLFHEETGRQATLTLRFAHALLLIKEFGTKWEREEWAPFLESKLGVKTDAAEDWIFAKAVEKSFQNL